MKLLLPLFVAFALSIVGVNAQQTAAGQTAADLLFHQLIDAQAAKNYDAFVAHGTTVLKAALTKTQFDASSDLMIGRLKGGCDIDPLCEMNKKGAEVYLYRLRFKDGGDDMLGTMSLKDGQVAGIYFQ